MSKDIAALEPGTWAAPAPSARRTPCPMLNSLANHGFLPRDGQEVGDAHFQRAMRAAGVAPFLGALFYKPLMVEYNPSKHPGEKHALPGNAAPRSFFSRLWYLLTNPMAIFMGGFGLRSSTQFDDKGNKCIDLDQLQYHNVTEHDISISRRDFVEGDNATCQPVLVQELLDASSDGVVLTPEDLAKHRRRRVEEQTKIHVNNTLNYGKLQHFTACGEAALLLNILGDGKSVPCEYIKPFFEEGRLPYDEGWKQRTGGNTLGAMAFFKSALSIRKLVGLKI